MVYCSGFALRFFYKVSALWLTPFESPTHRQKRMTFELSVFFCCVAMALGYACKPAAYRHIPTSLKRLTQIFFTTSPSVAV